MKVKTDLHLKIVFPEAMVFHFFLFLKERRKRAKVRFLVLDKDICAVRGRKLGLVGLYLLGPSEWDENAYCAKYFDTHISDFHTNPQFWKFMIMYLFCSSLFSFQPRLWM